MKGTLLAGAVVPAILLISKQARGADLTPLDATDSIASALGFIPDASKIDANANSAYKPGQRCDACTQFQGKSGDVAGACTIFAGHTVPASGWCQAFVQRA